MTGSINSNRPKSRSRGVWAPAFAGATITLEPRAKPAMHAPLSTEDISLKPDNDPTPAPFGAFAPNAAQAALIALAHRSRLKRGAFRPMLSRLVNLFRAGPVDVS